MRTVWRQRGIRSQAFCLLLALTVPTLSACTMPRARAVQDRGRVSQGMDRDQVRGLLGEPDAFVCQGEQEVWIYRYRWGSGALYWTGQVLLVLVVLPLVVLAAAGKSSVKTGKGLDEPPVQFRIYFRPEPEGVVFWLSDVEPLTKMPGETEE